MALSAFSVETGSGELVYREAAMSKTLAMTPRSMSTENMSIYFCASILLLSASSLLILCLVGTRA